MKDILGTDFYWGGTYVVKTDDGSYFVDRRLDTETPYSVFSEYPKDDSVEVDKHVAYELIALLSRYAPPQGKECQIRDVLGSLHAKYQILT